MPLKKISKQSAKLYFISFLIPICIYSIIILSYQFGLGEIYVKSFSYIRIPMLGLASVAFHYYIRNTGMFHLPNSFTQLTLATSYGLSSYILAQESNVLILLAYSLFPILFLTYEWMISDNKHIPFIIGNAVLLLICPIIGIPVTILLYLLSFFELSLQKKFRFGNFLHTTGNFLLSILTGSFGIIYYLAPYYSDHETYAYNGFQIVHDFAFFLSRFLPGSAPSKQFFFQYNKIDLYFGLFTMTLALLFFFQRNINFQKRLFYAIFSLILITGIELTPLQYILNLFINTERYSIAYSFVLIFWALRLASESLSKLKHSTKFPIIISICLMALLLGISWCFLQHNFLSWMLIVHICMLSITFVLLLSVQNKHRNIYKILAAVICFELFFNTFVLTNMNFKPHALSVNAHFIYQQTSNQANNADSKENQNKNTLKNDLHTTTATITADDYQAFISKYTNKQTKKVLTALRSLELLDEKGYRKYSGKILPNDFEQLNALCHKLGIKEDLFTACDVSFSFSDNSGYKVIPLGNNIYNITSPAQEDVQHGFIPYSIQCNTKTNHPIYLLDNSTAQIIELKDALLSGKENAVLQIGSFGDYIPSSINYQILCYSMDVTVLNQLPALIQEVQEINKNKKTSYMTYDIIGIVFSYIGLMLLLILLFYNKKKQLYQNLYQTRSFLTKLTIIQKISRHFRYNKVYYLAFLLPVLLILCIFISTDCMPFGSHSMFDEDGIALTLPEYFDIHYNALDDNTYLSLHGGYTTNTYSNSPLIKLYQFYKFLSTSQIIILQQLIFMFCVGFSGIAIVYYLVHRHNRPVTKQDMRLLIPSLLYSLNAYMLRCHSFNTWYYIYLLFPILLIAFQRLLYQKKWLAYSLILGCCIILNLQLSMYICIFLVIQFFCHKFQSICDFFQKGIRFAWSSLLAGGCGFFVISNQIITYQQLYYKTTDSEFPSPGLHCNFLTEWKNYMIYSPASFVSQNDGDLFAYCGIITLFLVLAYFVSRKYNWQEKLRHLIPILFLCISFNGQILSYLWNGLHYQSSVPNRYTFLLLFLLSEIAYDGITIVCSLSRKTISCISISIILFFLCCQSYDKGNTNLAFAATMLLCLFYLILHLWYKHSRKQGIYVNILLLLSILEIYSNGLYAGNNWLVESVLRYGNYEQQAEFNSEILKDSTKFYRSIYTGTSLYNSGKVYHTNGNGAFNSMVSNYQTNLNLSYGFQSGANNIYNDYFSNRMGLALSSTRYLFLYTHTTPPIQDLKQYHYIGLYNRYYVFENPNYLSLGFRVSESALHLDTGYKDVVHSLPPHYHNLLAKEFLQTDKNLCSIHPIYMNNEEEKKNTPNTFYFTDENNNFLSTDDAIKQYNKISSNTKKFLLKLHINYSVPNDGYLYLYANELDGLGYAHQGELFQTTIDMPNLNDALAPMYYMVVLKEDVFQEFYDNASQNQLENITIKNDTITGTTDYDEDGYTMLSIPYDKGWTAYIDGKETTIENPYDAGIYVKTPAGKHTLTLKFVPYGMKISQLITLGFWILTILLALCGNYFQRKKQE